jgi:hypothetical protein
MINLNRKNKMVNDLLEHSFISTKISVFMATKSAGEDYDPREKNYTYTNLNPITIRGYVRDVKPESLVWKQYGLVEVGMKEVLCEDKYTTLFRTCNKIEINGDEYQVYKENVGNRMLITQRPFKTVRILLSKVK